MKIVRKENGNILLTDSSGNTIKRLPDYAVLELKKDTEGEFIRVAYGHQNKHDIYVSQITATQIEPDAEVTFNGTGQDLLNLLSTSFFFEVSGGGSLEEVVFQEQDIATDSTGAIWLTRHTFNGELEAGTYQIDSYQELEILNLSGSCRNGVRIDGVITTFQVKGQTFLLSQAKQILNRFIYVHSGGTVLIEGQFRRFTAATLAQCNFSSLIIKKIA